MMERVAKGSGTFGSRTVQKALEAVPPRNEDKGLTGGQGRAVAKVGLVSRGVRDRLFFAEAYD